MSLPRFRELGRKGDLLSVKIHSHDAMPKACQGRADESSTAGKIQNAKRAPEPDRFWVQLREQKPEALVIEKGHWVVGEVPKGVTDFWIFRVIVKKLRSASNGVLESVLQLRRGGVIHPFILALSATDKNPKSREGVRPPHHV